MSCSRVTIFGGSGFLGRQIVRRLADDGAEVCVAVRHPEGASFLTGYRAAGTIRAVHADVWNEATVAPALEGSDIVINTVGHYVESGKATFVAIHGQGARHVAEAAASARVGRLVHISGIGADPHSASPYVRARVAGELLVTDAYPAATILRPSIMFGPEDSFFSRLAALARVMPVLPLFGAGDVRLQPVFVGDVADAAASVVTKDATRGKVYELGGPRVYSYKALLQLLLRQIGRKRLLMPVPYRVWRIVAALLSPLPQRPISHDQIILMMRDNVVSPNALSFADLGITPHAVEEILPSYLP